MKPIRDWAPASKELWKLYARAVRVSRETSAGLGGAWGFCEKFEGGQLRFFCASHLALQAAAWEARWGWVCCIIMPLDFWFLAFGKETLSGCWHPWSKEDLQSRSPLLWGDSHVQLQSLRLDRSHGPGSLSLIS